MSYFLFYLRSSYIIRVLSNTSYLYFILSVISSQIASNLMNIVFIFLIFHLRPSNFLVSLLLLTFIIPQIFLSFIGGVLADVKNKRLILIYGNIIRAAALLLLFFNPNSIFLIYAISLIISIVTQFYIPAEIPLIPKIVSKELLTAANSLFGIALFGSILIGYVLAGPLITKLGWSYIFIFLSAIFALTSVFIYLIPRSVFITNKGVLSAGLPQIKSSIIDELMSTYKMLISSKGVLTSLLLLSSSQVIVLILATVIPGYAKTILEVPTEDLSIFIFSPAALGMIISSLLIGAFWNKTKRSKLMTIGLFISALVLCLFPLTSKIITRNLVYVLNTILPSQIEITKIHFAVLLSFFAGFSNALIFVPSQTTIQEKIPESFRSRVYGLLFGVVGLFSLVPILLSGGIADVFGVGTVLFTVGFIIFIVAVLRSIKLSFFS